MVSHVEGSRPLALSERRVDWNPYVAGAAIGILSWIVFAVVDDPLGITTAFSALSGFVAMPLVGADTVAANSYWKATPPALNYSALFVAGVVLGAFVSAWAARQFRNESVPQVWRDRFGPSPLKRCTWAFLAGALEMYGARMAGGCTSGHALSGGMQLALSSWIFTIVIFAAAIATGRILYGTMR